MKEQAKAGQTTKPSTGTRSFSTSARQLVEPTIPSSSGVPLPPSPLEVLSGIVHNVVIVLESFEEMVIGNGGQQAFVLKAQVSGELSGRGRGNLGENGLNLTRNIYFSRMYVARVIIRS